MDRVLQAVLRSFMRYGTLRLTTSRGSVLEFGDGTGTPVAVRFTTRAAEWAVLFDPELAVGECYMNGTLVIEQGSIADFLALLVENAVQLPRTPWVKFAEWIRGLRRAALGRNTARRASNNASHHYDIDKRIYELFLDPDWQYSCAYFENPDDSLEAAQLAKQRHIAAKLYLEDEGLRVLDIGSGWGGLGLFLATIRKTRVTGITLSEEQFVLSCRRAEKEDRVEFRLQDYRNVAERFDRIVSVGMFEHVGKADHDTFFRKCHELLEDDGVMVLHTVGRLDGPSDTNPWVWKYIFPGGYAPALSELAQTIERSKFILADVEVLRLHYAYTLQAWRTAFDAEQYKVRDIFASDPALVERFGSADRFIRMWDFYLAGFEQFFRHCGLVVFQLQLIKKINTLPLTRSYLYETSLRQKLQSPLQAAE